MTNKMTHSKMNKDRLCRLCEEQITILSIDNR